MTMKLKKLYHGGIPVVDIDQSRDFYTKVIGMHFLAHRRDDCL